MLPRPLPPMRAFSMTVQPSLEPDDMQLIVQLGWRKMSARAKEAPAWNPTRGQGVGLRASTGCASSREQVSAMVRQGAIQVGGWAEGSNRI